MNPAVTKEIENRLAAFRGWRSDKELQSCRLVQYCGPDVIASDIPLAEVESQIAGLLGEGFYVDWNCVRQKLYLRVWEFGFEEPSWEYVYAEVDLPHSLPEISKVWNRAVSEHGGPEARSGDRALAGLLLVHGMIMNGGLGHAFDTLSEEDIRRGKEGYLYFGFRQAAKLLDAAKRLDEEGREDLTDAYREFIANDSTIETAYEKRFRESPEEFAPLK